MAPGTPALVAFMVLARGFAPGRLAASGPGRAAAGLGLGARGGPRPAKRGRLETDLTGWDWSRARLQAGQPGPGPLRSDNLTRSATQACRPRFFQAINEDG